MARRILIVDDEQELALALAVRFRAAGYTCETAKDGAEALDKVARGRPDLIVADVVMPVLDGYAMCHALRASGDTAKIPVVILTASPGRKVEEKFRQLGVAGFIHKPFEFTELAAVVQDALGATTTGGWSHGGSEEHPRRG